MGHKSPKKKERKKERKKEIKLSGPAWQEMTTYRPIGTIRGKCKAR